jgi:transposase InsO family protein
MSQASSISARKRYGLQRVCRMFQAARSSVYFQRESIGDADRHQPTRRGPVGACADEELVTHIRVVLAQSPFHGEGYRKVWARLRHRAVRTSKERVRRLMREHGLQAPHRVGAARGPRAHDGTITTDTPDTRWGTDLTTTVTLEQGQAAVFVAVDHCTCECVGLHAARSANRFEALEPIRQGIRAHFGCFTEGVAIGLELRHDHGSQYMSDDFQNELAFLGIESSPSFVRAPEGNGCAERFIRTLKENLLWVRTFRTIDELREALSDFKTLYNEQWLIERHGHRTPAQVRQEKLASTPATVAA